MTAELRCREPEGLRHIHATFNIRIQRAGAQVNKYNPLQSCVIAASPRLKMVSQPSALTSDRYVDIDTRLLRPNLQRKIAVLLAETDSHLKRRDTQCNRHYNAKVHVEPELVPKKWVFIETLFLTGKANTADGMAKAS